MGRINNCQVNCINSIYRFFVLFIFLLVFDLGEFLGLVSFWFVFWQISLIIQGENDQVDDRPSDLS